MTDLESRSSCALREFDGRAGSISVPRAVYLLGNELMSFAELDYGILDIILVQWHDGHSLGVDGAEVGVLEERDQIGLGGFLKSDDRSSLESKVVLEILGDLTNESLERQLAHQKFGGLLVATDLSKSDGSGSVSVRLLDSARCRRALSGGLSGELLTRGFTPGRLTRSLLGSSHLVLLFLDEVSWWLILILEAALPSFRCFRI